MGASKFSDKLREQARNGTLYSPLLIGRPDGQEFTISLPGVYRGRVTVIPSGAGQ